MDEKGHGGCEGELLRVGMECPPATGVSSLRPSQRQTGTWKEQHGGVRGVSGFPEPGICWHYSVNHEFHQLKVRVITESTTFPPGKEAAGTVFTAVAFHLLQAGLEGVKSQSSL